MNERSGADETGTGPVPLSRGEHIEVNRLMVSFLEAAWRGDEDTAALTLAQLESRELPAALGALASMAQHALATSAPEGAFISACRALLDRAEAGEP
ncbi:hypothetical protein [Brachybacterium tyrofermentans]|uniref:hypothetical protein n=1 Tax=Brachybacterium tyrofermentans TaxID=47848 RepID=UPI003F8FAB07